MNRIEQIEHILEFYLSPLTVVHIHRYHRQQSIHLIHAKTQDVHERTHKYDLQILLPAEI